MNLLDLKMEQNKGEISIFQLAIFRRRKNKYCQRSIINHSLKSTLFHDNNNRVFSPGGSLINLIRATQLNNTLF